MAHTGSTLVTFVANVAKKQTRLAVKGAQHTRGVSSKRCEANQTSCERYTHSTLVTLVANVAKKHKPGNWIESQTKQNCISQERNRGEDVFVVDQLTMSSTASLAAVNASTATKGMTVVTHVREDTWGMDWGKKWTDGWVSCDYVNIATTASEVGLNLQWTKQVKQW